MPREPDRDGAGTRCRPVREPDVPGAAQLPAAPRRVV